MSDRLYIVMPVRRLREGSSRQRMDGADAIIRLFDNPAEFRRQGESARESYFDIVPTDQETAYGRLFAAVEWALHPHESLFYRVFAKQTSVPRK